MQTTRTGSAGDDPTKSVEEQTVTSRPTSTAARSERGPPHQGGRHAHQGNMRRLQWGSVSG